MKLRLSDHIPDSISPRDLETGLLLLFDLGAFPFFSDESILDAEEAARFQKIVSEERKTQFVQSRWIAKTLISGLMAVDPSEISFRIVGEGRPELHEGDFDFNISHSDQWLLVGLCQNGRIGVDIEKIRERKNWREISQKVFTDSELRSLESLTEKEFYMLWALKESVLKAHGGGVFKHAKQVEFSWETEWKLLKLPAEFAKVESVTTSLEIYESFVVAATKIKN